MCLSTYDIDFIGHKGLIPYASHSFSIHVRGPREIISHLGIYEVTIYHGHKGLGILSITCLGQTSSWTFTVPHTDDLRTRGFPISYTDKDNYLNQYLKNKE